MRIQYEVGGLVCLAALFLACGDDVYLTPVPVPKPEPTAEKDAGAGLQFQQVVTAPAAALMSVHGTSASNVWFSGADDGKGPLVLRFDGESWQRFDTGVRGDWWWVNAISETEAWFAGTDASLFHFVDGKFARVPTPGLGKHTVYGVWAASPKDVYAVGSAAGRNGFVWHFAGDRFEELALPDTLPLSESHDQPGLFKVWGRNENDVWVVGGRGVVLHGSAQAGFELLPSGTDETLFTVTADADQMAVVGGSVSGVALRATGDEIESQTPDNVPVLQGVALDPDGSIWASGYGGAVFHGKPGKLAAVDTGVDVPAAHSLHAVWAAPDGAVWTVGGDVLTPNLDHGIVLYRGSASIPRLDVSAPPAAQAVCPESAIDPKPGASIARRWNEQIMGAIRRDIPRPTVHARNLFHLSVALWDTYAAFDPNLIPYLDVDAASAGDSEQARQEAMSFAAYRVLSHRYRSAVGGAVSQACFDAFMHRLGYDLSQGSTDGNSPSAFGNRVGTRIITTFAGDGANEMADYADPDKYEPDNPYCVVDQPGTHLRHPTLWQKLILAKAETQNGIAVGAGAQGYIGAQWRDVTPFALVRDTPAKPYLDIGSPPVNLNDELKQQIVFLIERSSEMDPNDETTIDISPGAIGNNPLGTNDGKGFAENPVTGAPYVANSVRRSDFARTLAEFWADGPASETPPGHWNVLANDVSDKLDKHQLFGSGADLPRLDWDVRLYLALNGALHDAAIVAWELKRTYVSARPISWVRYLAGLGQSSDPNLPSYHADGLPLIPGVIELITEQSSAAGGPHAHLRRYIGEIALKAWQGEPGDRKRLVGGVGFVRAADWMPYQRRTFVTPAFPGYVSGHSTFSRAAAQVLTELTGSEFFPGGLHTYPLAPGYLVFEYGPRDPVELQWATYYDAADQAGQSRLWGGIHIHSDDLDGRRIGDRVGRLAVERARPLIELQ